MPAPTTLPTEDLQLEVVIIVVTGTSWLSMRRGGGGGGGGGEAGGGVGEGMGEEYIDSGRPHVVHTAWGMLGLIYAGQVELDPAPLYRAAKELINMQLETGEFPQQEILGSFNSSLFFNYTNYRNLFPIWALGEFHRRLLAKRA
ncbi:hypothetical protein OsJ_33652 [Oryza sativa Japonica Group]|uniref:Similar to cycloartenol synthase n=1 Tax=Oryza sativa subsp. japonica TaxID=39947 RepID=Q53MU6_ORYSJ|nr:Similar to cycloartenol synthase [Oryza sativa Japonica Group]EAZ18107.1 hypothetical protein OsJ_33652 [Oryza sativa Japonica Group]